MRQILLFGAGKSSSALIKYLLTNASAENWFLTIADANPSAIKEKIGNAAFCKLIAIDISNCDDRNALIVDADIVISLLPPSLHFLVAKDCLHFRKNLLTASYADEELQSLKGAIEKEGLLFLCEMGLDPGIDHMSAKKLIDTIHTGNGKVISFLSHCGGLVAPESDDNPWHYKISWNPRNVVLAGKKGAIFKQEGEIKELEYEALFETKRYVLIPAHEALCWYPNRDSLRYISLYGMQEAETFIRTTLRHPNFIYGWKNLIELKLTDEQKLYNTEGKTLQAFFKEHMDRNDFGGWIEKKMADQFDSTKSLLSELVQLVNLEEEARNKGVDSVEEFMMIDDKGELQDVDIDRLKISAAATVADSMHNANLTLKQLFYLGMDDDSTIINNQESSAADVLQFALEQKLSLLPNDKDMVIMMHEIIYEKEGKQHKTTSTLLLKGEDAVHTAMAKTVGLPLGIATKLILNGVIQCKGLHIPITKEIYEPVLKELAQNGIVFTDETLTL